MDAARWRRVEEVLDVALTHEPAQWPTVLDDACHGDAELRREVEALLGRLGTARGFLETPPAAAAAALLAESKEAGRDALADRRVGAYRLVREVGRGGMSRVYLAERADGQFEQRVALKVLRPGLDSEIDLERFRAERQILASLNHPNIARLLDGGVSDDGLPFLVMEFVEGEPLDQYCARRNLSIPHRLALFRTVIDATQYAHRNLVVHRDLKPSNVLVTSDGVVKLLDFGLAKLLDPAYSATPSAPMTKTGHRWMTPEYAAPEQVRGEAVTTLTDVYQLGAVLYELVSGRLPFGASTSVHELERAVLERDPEPLGDELRGDVEAIVVKAMHKAPEDRYASAQDLGEDIRRHLSGYPVLARHHTSGYLTRRFVRRHRAALAGAAVMVMLLATYVVTVAADRARIARALTEATAGTRKAEQTTDFMLGLFEAAEGGQSLTDTVTAHELLNRGVAQAHELSSQPDLEAQMLDVIGRLQVQLGDYDLARPLLEEALTIRRRLYGENHADVATSLENLADAAELKDPAENVKLRREALSVRRSLLGDTDPKTMTALFNLASALHSSDQGDEANRLFDQWLSLVDKQPREISATRAEQLTSAGSILTERQQNREAEALHRQALEIRKTVFGPRHHLVAASLVDVATLLTGVPGRRVEADSLLREAVTILRSAFPDGHPMLADALRWHGQMLSRLGRTTEAIAPLQESLAMRRRFTGPNATEVANTDIDLATVFIRLDRYAEAEQLARDAVRIHRALFGDRNAMVYLAQISVGEALRGEHRYAEAESLLLASYARFAHPNPITRGWRGDALVGLVRLYEAEGKPAESAKYRAMLAETAPLPTPAAK